MIKDIEKRNKTISIFSEWHGEDLTVFLVNEEEFKELTSRMYCEKSILFNPKYEVYSYMYNDKGITTLLLFTKDRGDEK